MNIAKLINWFCLISEKWEIVYIKWFDEFLALLWFNRVKEIVKDSTVETIWERINLIIKESSEISANNAISMIQWIDEAKLEIIQVWELWDWFKVFQFPGWTFWLTSRDNKEVPFSLLKMQVEKDFKITSKDWNIHLTDSKKEIKIDDWKIVHVK